MTAAFAHCSPQVPRSCSAMIALPPIATTIRIAPSGVLRAPDREPDGARRPVVGVCPRVWADRAEVNRVAGLKLVRLAVDSERHPPVEHEHELLAGMAHRFGPRVSERLKVGLGAGNPERAVTAGDVLGLKPLLGGVRPGALVGTDH